MSLAQIAVLGTKWNLDRQAAGGVILILTEATMPRTNKPADGATNLPRPARPAKNSDGAAEDFNDPDAIARRAYEIYQNRGGNHGADLDDWLEAERQLKPGPSDVTGPAPQKPRRRRKTSEESA
jgi:hypothetical protein